MIIQEAGCILINKETKKVCLVFGNNKHDYTFPKGHLVKGETLEGCAVRKIREKTNHICELELHKEIKVLSFVDEDGYTTKIHYYLAVDKGEVPNNALTTFKVVWKDVDEVSETLTYCESKKMWDSIKENIKKLMK